MFWSKFPTMKAFIIFCVCLGVIASEKVCSQIDVALAVRPCAQIFLQGGMPGSEKEMCRSGKVQKVTECYTNALKECKKDEELKLLVEKFGIDQFQKINTECKAKYDVVAPEKVCSKVEVARLVSPCFQPIMQGGMPRSEEELCRRGMLQKIEECLTNALKECIKDDDFKQLWARTGLDQIQKKNQECQAKSGGIASEMVCSQIDVARAVRPCFQLFMRDGLPGSEEEMCRSGKVQKLADCYTNALKECKKDDKLKLLVKKFGIDNFQKINTECKARYD